MGVDNCEKLGVRYLQNNFWEIRAPKSLKKSQRNSNVNFGGKKLKNGKIGKMGGGGNWAKKGGGGNWDEHIPKIKKIVFRSLNHKILKFLQNPRPGKILYT